MAIVAREARGVAGAFGLPAPPRASRATIAARRGGSLPQVLLESRRLANGRLARELGYRLRWPNVNTALEEIRAIRAAGGR